MPTMLLFVHALIIIINDINVLYRCRLLLFFRFVLFVLLNVVIILINEP